METARSGDVNELMERLSEKTRRLVLSARANKIAIKTSVKPGICTSTNSPLEGKGVEVDATNHRVR